MIRIKAEVYGLGSQGLPLVKKSVTLEMPAANNLSDEECITLLPAIVESLKIRVTSVNDVIDALGPKGPPL